MSRRAKKEIVGIPCTSPNFSFFPLPVYIVCGKETNWIATGDGQSLGLLRRLAYEVMGF